MIFFSAKRSVSLRSLLLLSIVFSLPGCGWLTGPDGYFRDRSGDYRKVEIVEDLQVPAQTPGHLISDLLVIPPTSQVLQEIEEFEAPFPPVIASSQDEDLIRVQKLGQQRWILINLPPSKLWPRVRDFLLVNRVALSKEDGEHGVLETRWLLRDGDDVSRERYRFVVTQGVQRDTSEVHVIQTEQKRTEAVDSRWPEVSVNEEREVWMIDQITDFMATTVSQPSVSLLAQGLTGEPRLSFIDSDKDPRLVLQLPFNRAWASMAHALKKAEFRIDDINREEGYFLATYLPLPTEDEKPGFWRRLFGAEDPEHSDKMFAGQQFKLGIQPVTNASQQSAAIIRVLGVLEGVKADAEMVSELSADMDDDDLSIETSGADQEFTTQPLNAKNQGLVLILFKGYLS
jgi:outer membrane protein assembly factor BamC